MQLRPAVFYLTFEWTDDANQDANSNIDLPTTPRDPAKDGIAMDSMSRDELPALTARTIGKVKSVGDWVW